MQIWKQEMVLCNMQEHEDFKMNIQKFNKICIALNGNKCNQDLEMCLKCFIIFDIYRFLHKIYQKAFGAIQSICNAEGVSGFTSFLLRSVTKKSFFRGV